MSWIENLSAIPYTYVCTHTLGTSAGVWNTLEIKTLENDFDVAEGSQPQ